MNIGKRPQFAERTIDQARAQNRDLEALAGGLAAGLLRLTLTFAVGRERDRWRAIFRHLAGSVAIDGDGAHMDEPLHAVGLRPIEDEPGALGRTLFVAP